MSTRKTPFDRDPFHQKQFELIANNLNNPQKDFSEFAHEQATFQICLSDPEYGWVDGRFWISGEPFTLLLSDAYNPFFDLLRWVENLCHAKPSLCPIYDEFRDVYFANIEHDQSDYFTLVCARAKWPYSHGMRINAYLSRRKVVEQFYQIFCHINVLQTRFEAWDQQWYEVDDPDQWSLDLDHAPFRFTFRFGSSEEPFKPFDLTVLRHYLGDSDPVDQSD